MVLMVAVSDGADRKTKNNLAAANPGILGNVLP
jgi:hypothetical protein